MIFLVLLLCDGLVYLGVSFLFSFLFFSNVTLSK